MVGVRVDGTKELIALAEGYRESAGQGADLLRDCVRRGMRAPVLAVGDGALGFWSALREVFPATRTQRCWFPQDRQRAVGVAEVGAPGCETGPRRDLERRGPRPRPPGRRGVQTGLRRQIRQSRRQNHRRPRRTPGVLRLPRRALGTSAHDQPESTFATVRHRTKVTKGPGSKAAGLAMAVKLIQARSGPLARGQRPQTRRARPCPRHPTRPPPGWSLTEKQHERAVMPSPL